jgi:hypothetical protein
MAVALNWQEPDKIFRFTYSGRVEPKELTEPIEVILSHLNKAQHPIHVIVDWRNATDLPFFADFVFTGKKLIQHKNMGWLIVVGRSKIVELWLKLFEGIANIRYKVFDTPEEAVEFLRTVVMS